MRKNYDKAPPEEASEIEVRQPLGAEPTPAGDIAAKPPSEEEADDPSTLRRQRDEYHDLLLRTTAEFDNYRKRIDRERREMTEAAAADILREILPAIDDLERALKADAGTEGVEAYRRGVEIIHRQLLDLLRKRGVTPLEALGADFDPHYHQAVAQEVSQDHREGEVIEEFRRGYLLGGRLLRPAMVKVAKVAKA